MIFRRLSCDPPLSVQLRFKSVSCTFGIVQRGTPCRWVKMRHSTCVCVLHQSVCLNPARGIPNFVQQVEKLSRNCRARNVQPWTDPWNIRWTVPETRRDAKMERTMRHVKIREAASSTATLARATARKCVLSWITEMGDFRPRSAGFCSAEAF